MTYDPSLSWEENVRIASTSTMKFPKLHVVSDTPEYISPITGKPIDGRVARKEDLKRAGCVEADPPKHKREFRKERYKRGATLEKRARG